ncbi:hypothetical protein [Vibrio stylophorae]|nr:hypothetical protein [Vibrio stylophorae]
MRLHYANDADFIRDQQHLGGFLAQKTEFGASQEIYHHNDQGYLESIELLSNNTSLMNMRVNKRDEKGRVLEMVYFDQNNEPYGTLTVRFDDKNREQHKRLDGKDGDVSQWIDTYHAHGFLLKKRSAETQIESGHVEMEGIQYQTFCLE